MPPPARPAAFARDLLRRRRERTRRWARLLWFGAALLASLSIGLTIVSWTTWRQGLSELDAFVEAAPVAIPVMVVTLLGALIVQALWSRWALPQAIEEDVDPGPLGEHEEAATALISQLAEELRVKPPIVRLVHDPVPNALAARLSNGKTICLTTGAFSLPQTELEGLVLNELIRLELFNLSLFRRLSGGRRWAMFASVLAALVSVFAILATGGDRPWWGLIGLIALGHALAVAIIAKFVWPGSDVMRQEFDHVSDALTAELVRYPGAYVGLLDRMARDERAMSHTSNRVAELWFRPSPPATTASEAKIAAEQNRRLITTRAQRVRRIVFPAVTGS